MSKEPLKSSVLSPQSSSLKIGLLTGELSPKHGWARYSLSLIKALQAAGVNMTVVTARNSPDVSGISIHKLLPAVVPAERFLLLKQLLLLPRLRALLRDCDVIHATIEPFAPLAAWTAGKRPLFITGHGSYVQLPLMARWPSRLLYRRAFRRGTLVCVSRYTARVAAGVLPGVRTVIVNNGVDAERFSALPPLRVRRPKEVPAGEGGQGEGFPTVLAVGAVKARKGTLELARAMAAVRQQTPHVRCNIVGSLSDTAYVERVRSEIRQLGLDDCVSLVGYVPDETLPDWYGTADVFVLPAMNEGRKFEGYGLVYLEASAAGLPVIGTMDTGAADAIDDGVTGLLVSQQRIADELPRAIRRILNDPALAARMGAAGRAKAQSQTWARVADRILMLYHRSLHSPKFGSAKGLVQMADDFDAPLSDFDEYQ